MDWRNFTLNKKGAQLLAPAEPAAPTPAADFHDTLKGFHELCRAMLGQLDNNKRFMLELKTPNIHDPRPGLTAVIADMQELFPEDSTVMRVLQPEAMLGWLRQFHKHLDLLRPEAEAAITQQLRGAGFLPAYHGIVQQVEAQLKQFTRQPASRALTSHVSSLASKNEFGLFSLPAPDGRT